MERIEKNKLSDNNNLIRQNKCALREYKGDGASDYKGFGRLIGLFSCFFILLKHSNQV